jgi:nitrile hydratase beta subunit-like protein
LNRFNDYHFDHHRPQARVGIASRLGYFDMLEAAVRELLIEKQYFSADEFRRQLEVLNPHRPMRGGKALQDDPNGLYVRRIRQTDGELEPWERRCHALADLLDSHEIIDAEQRRCGVELLGAEMIDKLTHYERWIVAFAKVLLQKGTFTPAEIILKMEAVRKSRNAGADISS